MEGYSCPTPGSDGYLFQPAPCRFGPYAGEAVYCDESTEGDGIVGIRDEVNALLDLPFSESYTIAILCLP